MIKVMIVEDDMMFRYAVRSIIDWEAHGFIIAAEAVNGRHALELVEQSLPDVVLTDISMPQLDGIGLIKCLKQIHPEIKIIVLSAYDDFGFVKEALKLGAEDYLLKYSLDQQVVETLMVQVKEKILRDKHENAKHRYLQQNLWIITNNFIKSILNGEMKDIQAIEQHIESLGLTISLNNLHVTLIETMEKDDINKSEAAGEQKFQYLTGLLKEVLNEVPQYVFADIGMNRYALILNYENSYSIANATSYIWYILQKMLACVEKDNRYVYTIGDSDLGCHISQLQRYYEQAKAAINEKVYLGAGKLYSYAHIPKPKNIEKEVFPADIYRAIKEKDTEQAEALTILLFENLLVMRLSAEQLEKECNELFSGLQFLFDELNLSAPKTTLHEYLALSKNKDKPYYINAKEYFTNIVRTFKSQNDKNSQYKYKIRLAAEYIDQNYSLNIQLADLALQLDISPNYLCNTFKKEIGIGIVDYINNVRVEKAKQLIKSTNLKSYEIAEKVGFSNASYFSTVFKNLIGCTVNHYRNHPIE